MPYGEKPWSGMSPHELMDRAQKARQLNSKEAELLLAAAQIQATENLTWTLENRILPSMADAMSQRRGGL